MDLQVTLSGMVNAVNGRGRSKCRDYKMRAALIGTLLKFKRSHYMQEKTLAELFADTWALIRETERVTDAETRRSNQERALSSLNAAISKTESSALFSSNEELEDVSTADLKYLLLPALRGVVLRDLVTSMSCWWWCVAAAVCPPCHSPTRQRLLLSRRRPALPAPGGFDVSTPVVRGLSAQTRAVQGVGRRGSGGGRGSPRRRLLRRGG